MTEKRHGFCTVLNSLILLCLLFSLPANAQDKVKRSWYASWGYSSEHWMPSDIHVHQKGLMNDFTLVSVKGHDEPDWNTGIFNKSLAEPQYNIRFGCFINAAHTRGFELSLDHTKYSVTENQVSRIRGIVYGEPVDKNVVLTYSYFRYVLHNGANHVMVNYVQRVALLRPIDKTFSLQAIFKGGAGIMLPHSDNTIMDNHNDVGPKSLHNAIGIKSGWWRLGGYTAGVEYGLRFAPVKWAYLEFTNKIAFAGISNIPVYNGTASQNLWMYEGIFSLGVEW